MNNTKIGGTRKGAGRPAIDNKRVLLSARVKPELLDKIKSSGFSAREFIELAIRQFNQ